MVLGRHWPVLRTPARAAFGASSYADILALVGFGDAERYSAWSSPSDRLP